MAKDKHKVSAEVEVDDLGVCTKHDFLMANDQDYRDAALTPPGGYAPGDGGKEPDPVSEVDGPGIGALVASATAV